MIVDEGRGKYIILRLYGIYLGMYKCHLDPFVSPRERRLDGTSIRSRLRITGEVVRGWSGRASPRLHNPHELSTEREARKRIDGQNERKKQERGERKEREREREREKRAVEGQRETKRGMKGEKKGRNNAVCAKASRMGIRSVYYSLTKQLRSI